MARVGHHGRVSDERSVFAGSMPEYYDRYFVPAVFRPYAVDLVGRLSVQSAAAVLELACGTGVLTSELRRRLPDSVRLVATDINPPMLDIARANLTDVSAIEWQTADCSALPFADASFSAVVCQFGFMFPPDKSAVVREARRVLTHGGLLAFNVWDSMEHNRYAAVVQETTASFFREDPPDFFNLPHGFGDAAFWDDLLRRNGFRRPHIELVARELVSDRAEHLALGMLRGTPMSTQIRQRNGNLEEIVSAVGAALGALGGSAPFRGSMRALVVTATVEQ
jgi:SAM-dependent methyltransferase